MVQGKTGVEPDQQLLIYNGVIMKDYYNDHEAELCDYFGSGKFA